MSHVIVCTVCSREKRTDPNSLPANQRYLGSHIKAVELFARKTQRPYFILSGVYGLLPAEECIPYYDHLLRRGEVELLARKIQRQLQLYGIREVHFFQKFKPHWNIYRDALIRATNARGVRLHFYELENDA